MKKYFIIALLFVSVSSFCQVTNDVYSERMRNRGYSMEVYGEDNVQLLKAKQIHMQKCLTRFSEQRQNGFWISILGAGGVGVGLAEDNDAVTYIGGGLSLLGFIMQQDAYKWLKRASVEPTRNGAVFRFKF